MYRKLTQAALLTFGVIAMAHPCFASSTCDCSLFHPGIIVAPEPMSIQGTTSPMDCKQKCNAKLNATTKTGTYLYKETGTLG